MCKLHNETEVVPDKTVSYLSREQAKEKRDRPENVTVVTHRLE